MLIALILIIFAVNFFGSYGFGRLDLTQGKEFTLSKATKDTLGKLTDVVTIKGYFSNNIPPPFNQSVREVADLLHEYEAYGKGNLKVEIINPAGSEAAQAEAESHGIQAANLPLQDANGVKIEKLWMAIYVEYLKKSELIPFVQSTETLEYDLTSTINRLTSPAALKIAFYNPDKDRKIFEEFGQLKSVLDKEFTVEEVNTEGGKPIDPGYKALILANPFHVTQRDLFEVDQYLMKGGQAIILTDGSRVILRPLRASRPALCECGRTAAVHRNPWGSPRMAIRGPRRTRARNPPFSARRRRNSSRLSTV